VKSEEEREKKEKDEDAKVHGRGWEKNEAKKASGFRVKGKEREEKRRGKREEGRQ
jgi:hypothetical protein